MRNHFKSGLFKDYIHNDLQITELVAFKAAFGAKASSPTWKLYLAGENTLRFNKYAIYQPA